MSTKTKKSPDNTHKLNRRAICLRAPLALIILLAIFLVPQRSASTKEPPQDPAKEETEMIAPNVEVLKGQAIMRFVDADPNQLKTFILVTGRRDPRMYAIDLQKALRPENNNTPNAIVSRSKVALDRLDGQPLGDSANVVISEDEKTACFRFHSSRRAAPLRLNIRLRRRTVPFPLCRSFLRMLPGAASRIRTASRSGAAVMASSICLPRMAARTTSR
jgi:hypothetical protein